MPYQKDGCTFPAWMARVDAEMVALCGMASSDVDDWDYATAFEDGVTPKAAAKRAIRNAKENCGLV